MTTEKAGSALAFSLSFAAMKVAATGAAVWPGVVLGCVAILAVTYLVDNRMKHITPRGLTGGVTEPALQ